MASSLSPTTASAGRVVVLPRVLRDRLATLAMDALARLLLRQARRALATLPLPEAVARRSRLRVRHVGQLPTLRAALQRALRGDARPCLPRSLVLHGQFRALGFAPVLVMGAARHSLGGDGALQAHAWIELDDIPYLEAAGFRREDHLVTFRSDARDHSGFRREAELPSGG